MSVQEKVTLDLDRFASDRFYRLSSLYYIRDKDGKKTLFKPNWAQQELYSNMWYRNVILKARQLGFTTAITMYLLDHCLWTQDAEVGIIAHTFEDVKKIFNRVRYAYENLPDVVKQAIYPLRDSTTELALSNGSILRVGLSMRSSTLQILHVSEIGKICAQYPDKAREIQTGAIETVPQNGIIFLESTAEGQSGFFKDICAKAEDMQNKELKLTPLDFRFHFFPWHRHPEYRMDMSVYMPRDLEEYFEKLEGQGVLLGPSQKAWYAKKRETLGDEMAREYPSDPQECWAAASAGLLYGSQMSKARLERRICHVPYDPQALVHTAWDIGMNDATAVILFQTVGREVHIFDYIEGNGKSLTEYIHQLQRMPSIKEPYQYGKHLGPHDLKVRELSTGTTRLQTAANLGFNFSVVSRVEDLMHGINQVRDTFPRIYIDAEKCKGFIEHIDKYSKRWMSDGYWGEPLHDEHSHAASALMQLVRGLDLISHQGFTEAQKRQIDMARMRRY